MNRPDDPSFDVRADDGCATITLHGEFDVAGVALWRARTARAAGDVLVDLTCLRFVDASGLGALVGLASAPQADGHRLIVTNPSRSLRRTFSAAGLDHLLAA